MSDLIRRDVPRANRKKGNCWWCGEASTREHFGRQLCNADECYRAAKARPGTASATTADAPTPPRGC